MTSIGDDLAGFVYQAGEILHYFWLLVGHRFVLLAMLWIIVEIWMSNGSFGLNLIFAPLSMASILFWILIIPFMLGIIAFLMTVENFTVLHSPIFTLVGIAGYYFIFYQITRDHALFHELFVFQTGGIFMGGLIVLFAWGISVLAYC